jgi:hypothetical protein
MRNGCDLDLSVLASDRVDSVHEAKFLSIPIGRLTFPKLTISQKNQSDAEDFRLSGFPLTTFYFGVDKTANVNLRSTFLD